MFQLKSLILFLISIMVFTIGCEKKVFTHKNKEISEDDYINESMKETKELFNKLDQEKANRENKNNDEANQIVNVAPAIQSENKILVDKAMKLKEEGKFKEAIDILKKVLSEESKNISIMENISELYANLKNFDESKKYAQRILKLDKNNIFALTTMANIYAQNNDINAAIKTYLKLSELTPTYVLFHNIGVLYEKQGKLRKAFEFYKKAVRKQEDAKGYYALAIISQKLNNNKDVIEYLKKSVNRGADIKIKRILANEYLNQKMFREAKFLYEDIAKKSNNVNDYNNLANVYLSTKDYIKAEEIYKKALRVSPSDSMIQYNLALCYYKQRSVTKMSKMIKEYERSNPPVSKIRQLKVYLSKISK